MHVNPGSAIANSVNLRPEAGIVLWGFVRVGTRNRQGEGEEWVRGCVADGHSGS